MSDIRVVGVDTLGQVQVVIRFIRVDAEQNRILSRTGLTSDLVVVINS